MRKSFLRGALLTGVVGLALIIPACDRTEERLERAQDLGEAVLDQVSGNDENRPSLRDRMRRVPVEARAFAGQIQDTAVETSPSGSERVRYVIGSIVAKPRDMPEPVEAASVMSEPALAEDALVTEAAETKIIIPDQQMLQKAEADPSYIEQLEKPTLKTRSITVVDPRERYAQRSLSLKDQALPRSPLRERIERVRSTGPVPSAPEEIRIPKEAREKFAKLAASNEKLARRAKAMQAKGLARQLEAEDYMINSASRYNLAATIQRSRTGQMVIEVGSDAVNPTAFTPAALQRQNVAIENGVDCNEATLTNASENPLIAMECVMRDLQTSGEFEYVEKDYVFEHEMIRRPGDEPPATISVTPNDPLFGLQWNFLSQGEGPDASPGGAGFVDFWTDEGLQGAADVVVAVVDTGLELEHPDIKDSPNVMPGWDMVSDPDTGNDGDSRDSDPNDPGDICPERNVFANTFHGTHVAGIIGAGGTNNGSGVAGGAWAVKIVPVRALGKCGGRLSDINDAIRWAAGTIPEYDAFGEEVWNENPADIINLSIGLFRSCPASMQDAIDSVTAEGVTVVVAAGNQRVPTEFYAPAGCRNVVTVAGSDARGYLAPYSNYGADVDVLAPGGDLTRDDNGDGNPDGVLSTKSAENCADPLTGEAVSNCFYAYEQGTSMAAPHVSAALALLKARSPELTSSELVSSLLDGVGSIEGEQCTGLCSQFPGAEPTVDDPEICLRPCGSGLLNMGGVGD